MSMRSNQRRMICLWPKHNSIFGMVEALQGFLGIRGKGHLFQGTEEQRPIFEGLKDTIGEHGT